MQTDIIKYVIHFSKNKRNILIVQKPQCVIKPIRMQKNIPMFLFFIYVYICMQNRRQGTSIKGAFESLGGHKSRCVCVWGGGGEVQVCVGGWVRLGSLQSVIACSC